MPRTTLISLAITALGLGVVGLIWSGQTQAPQRSGTPPLAPAAHPIKAIDAVAGLPSTLDMIVVVDRAAELRASPVGQGVLRFLDDSGSLKDMADAWTALSNQLGWSEREAFDRLLGSRVVLASRAQGENDRRWAILSDVSADTERRLRERLRIAPRGISNGHQILSVENGAFELTTHRATPSPNPPGSRGTSQKPADTDRFTLVFGPTGRGELLDELVAALSRGGAADPMRASDAMDAAAAMGPTNVLVMVSTKRPAWSNFVILTAHQDMQQPDHAGRAWSAGVVVRDVDRQESLRNVELSDSGPFDTLAEGALAAVLQNAPLPDSGALGLSGASILSLLPIPETAKGLLTPRQAVAIRMLDDGRASCSLALHTTSTSRLATVMDSAVARGVETFEQRMRGSASPADLAGPPDYAGLAPDAVRVLPLPATGVSPMNTLTSRPLVLSWVYATRPGVNGPSNTVHHAGDQYGLPPPSEPWVGGEPESPGWLILNASQEPRASTNCDPVTMRAQSQGAQGPDMPDTRKTWPRCGPSPAEVARNDANALTTRATGALDRWILMARAEPRALERQLPALFPDFKGVRSMMRRFDTLDVRVRATERGDLEGTARIRFAADAP